jgi:hypothetical protein
VTAEQIAAFRANASGLAVEAWREGCAADVKAWSAVAELGDDAVAAVLGAGVYDRGWSADEILSFVGSNSERDAKRVRGLGAKTLALRAHVADIVGTFDGSMSVRQVFYQLVSRGAVRNTPAAYEGVSRLLVTMRRDGSIPHERIVDRTRRVHKLAGWDGVREAMASLAAQYRRDPWDGQATHVHVACEKQALEGVFSRVVDDYGAPLYVLRGFASEAFVFEWAVEIQRVVEDGHNVVVAYFGDHDPSGLAIEQDCRDRLLGHLSPSAAPSFTWRRCGLLFEDLDAYDLVNVPVKHGDSRARAYVAEHGDRAAELDALPPATLRDRILEAITSEIDVGAWEQVRAIEVAETESLSTVAGAFEAALAAARSAA